MISAQDALAAILSRAEPLSIEDCPLKDSLHRHLAGPVVAPIPLPPFDNSAMDGYVIAGEGDSFQIMPTIAAGDRGPSVIHPEEAFRIMTGAPVPEGAYAVVPFEEWPITKPVIRGDNIRRAGEDVAKGDGLFEAGERITSRTIALLAALGLETVRVFRRPRVRVLSTGSEIRPAGETLQHGQIYNSNGPALAAALKEMGIEAETVGAAVDDEGALKAALNRVNGGDVLITIGGVSAGDFDLVPKALKALGAQVVFHKVSIKPGKPLLYALWGRTHVFALPGNPVSALMVFDRFVRPALLKMMGADKILRTPHEAVAAEPLRGAAGKEVYLRGIVAAEDGRFIARSAGAQGSAMLRSLARANAVLIVPASKQRIAAGETLSFEFLEEGL